MKKMLIRFSPLSMLVLAQSAFAQTIDIRRPKNIPEFKIGDVISAVVGILLLVSAVLAFLYLIMGGIQWITSGGDKTGMEAARNKITHAIVGLIIVGAAWAIMILVQNFLGVQIIGGRLDFPKPF